MADAARAADVAAAATDAGGVARPEAGAPDAAVVAVAVDVMPTPDVAPPRQCPSEDAGTGSADGRGGDGSGGAVGALDAASDAGLAPMDASPVADATSGEAGAMRGEVLFLVNKRVAVPGDEALKVRLEALGFAVTTLQDMDSKTEDATGKVLVLVSASVSSTAIATKFRDAKVPVISMEPFVFDDFQMTAATSGTDFDFAPGQSEIFVENGRHPLAAGLRCAVTVATTAGQFAWGAPAASAEKVATVANDARRHVIFAYRTRAMMVGLAAPAARVGWFASESVAPSLNEDGLKLFDAAVEWALRN
jgi:hypothetical protein